MKTSLRARGHAGPASSPVSLQIWAETTPDGDRKSWAERCGAIWLGSFMKSVQMGSADLAPSSFKSRWECAKETQYPARQVGTDFTVGKVLKPRRPCFDSLHQSFGRYPAVLPMGSLDQIPQDDSRN